MHLVRFVPCSPLLCIFVLDLSGYFPSSFKSFIYSKFRVLADHVESQTKGISSPQKYGFCNASSVH